MGNLYLFKMIQQIIHILELRLHVLIFQIKLQTSYCNYYLSNLCNCVYDKMT